MRIRNPILDRRALITGRIADLDGLVTPPGAEIASVLVQVAARAAGRGRGRHPRDRRLRNPRPRSQGKLVVVIDAQNAGAIGATLNTIALLPNVYSASLVFHATDAA